MPARSRCRQRRGSRRSCTWATRRQHPPHRGIVVVGSTSQTSPSSVNSTLVTRVNLIPSRVLSKVVARMVDRGSEEGVVTPEVPPRPCAFHHHRVHPGLSREPLQIPVRGDDASRRRFHQTSRRAFFYLHSLPTSPTFGGQINALPTVRDGGTRTSMLRATPPVDPAILLAKADAPITSVAHRTGRAGRPSSIPASERGWRARKKAAVALLDKASGFILGIQRASVDS